jgi:hypothetical protein
MEKDDNNFYTNRHEYNDKHTENTKTYGLEKRRQQFLYKWTRLQLHAHGKYRNKWNTEKGRQQFFFIYEWTSLQLQTHGKYKQSREILNQKSVKVNACESLELSSSLVAMVKI